MQSKYQFIPFEKPAKGSWSDETISLSKSKVFVLWKGFIEKNSISPEKNRYAFLYYDSKEHAVAIRFIPNKLKDAFKVSYDKRGHGAAISCGNFLKAFKIEGDKYTGRYSVKKHHIEGAGEAFVIDLREKETDNLLNDKTESTSQPEN